MTAGAVGLPVHGKLTEVGIIMTNRTLLGYSCKLGAGLTVGLMAYMAGSTACFGVAAGKRIGGGIVVKGHGLPGLSNVAGCTRLSGIKFRIEA